VLACMRQEVDELVEVSLEVRRNDYRTVVDSSGGNHRRVVILRRVRTVIQQRIAHRYAHVVTAIGNKTVKIHPLL